MRRMYSVKSWYYIIHTQTEQVKFTEKFVLQENTNSC